MFLRPNNELKYLKAAIPDDIGDRSFVELFADVHFVAPQFPLGYIRNGAHVLTYDHDFYYFLNVLVRRYDEVADYLENNIFSKKPNKAFFFKVRDSFAMSSWNNHAQQVRKCAQYLYLVMHGKTNTDIYRQKGVSRMTFSERSLRIEPDFWDDLRAVYWVFKNKASTFRLVEEWEKTIHEFNFNDVVFYADLLYKDHLQKDKNEFYNIFRSLASAKAKMILKMPTDYNLRSTLVKLFGFQELTFTPDRRRKKIYQTYTSYVFNI